MKKSLCIASLVLGLTVHAFALAGQLTEPGVAFPGGFPESARNAITASLKRDDCKFIGGNFINSFTTLKYGGETIALNRFMEGLLNAPGTSISVTFQSDGVAQECDWFVTHSTARPRHFAVHVSTKSARIKLEELAIPEAKRPAHD